MKKIIIIGATSGIGRELAKRFAQDNCLVGITGRRAGLLDSLQAEFPGNIFTESFDVTGTENIFHLQQLIHKLGGLDLIIYGSGYGEPAETLNWEIEKQTTLINVNGFIEIINFSFNYFAKQGHGQIAGISSILSIHGNSKAPAYSASKAFMSTYLEGLSMKGSKMNIFVTDIQPGFVKTKIARSKQFWVSTVEKASEQIYIAIKNKKRRVYITRRWWIIAKLMKWMPYPVLKKLM